MEECLSAVEYFRGKVAIAESLSLEAGMPYEIFNVFTII